MQETWTFDYEAPLDPESLSDFLQTKSKDLGIFLSYYYKKDGAVAEKVELKGKLNFTDAKSGKFKLEFDLVFFNACFAINEQEKEEMEISFEINSLTQKLELKGAYWPERGMDEI